MKDNDRVRLRHVTLLLLPLCLGGCLSKPSPGRFLEPRYLRITGKANAGPYTIVTKGVVNLEAMSQDETIVKLPFAISPSSSQKIDLNMEVILHLTPTTGKLDGQISEYRSSIPYYPFMTKVNAEWEGGALYLRGQIEEVDEGKATAVLNGLIAEKKDGKADRFPVTGPAQQAVTSRGLTASFVPGTGTKYGDDARSHIDLSWSEAELFPGKQGISVRRHSQVASDPHFVFTDGRGRDTHETEYFVADQQAAIASPLRIDFLFHRITKVHPFTLKIDAKKTSEADYRAEQEKRSAMEAKLRAAR